MAQFSDYLKAYLSYIVYNKQMAFALISLFEPSIVKNIYEFALTEPTLTHVLFQNHAMLPQKELFVTRPNERATAGELQEETSQVERFKKNNWYPDEMHFLPWLMERMRTYIPMGS